MPSSPENLPLLVHESECTLLDRAFGFGDVVKRSLQDPQSGTIVSIETHVTLQPSFPSSIDTAGVSDIVEHVKESELKPVNDLNIGDFLIYKNSWCVIVWGEGGRRGS